MHRALLSTLLVAASLSASAGEVARQGKMWPVTERDMREVIMEQVAQVDRKAIQKELKKSVNAFLDSRPDYGLPAPQRSATKWLDLTWTLPEDLVIPEKRPDGGLAMRVLYPKGTKVNPVVANRPRDALVFFNGNNKRQVAAVKAFVKNNPERYVLIETAGNPDKVSVSMDRPVFHAERQLLERFAITHVPAVVFAGNGSRNQYYGVSVVAEPYSQADFSKIAELAFPPRSK